MIVRQRAYAKINLVLNVLGKRDDGYHEVDFLMTSVKLFDLISVQKSNVDVVVCENAPFIQKEKNLAYKAWILMKELYNLEGCITITIDKVIPISAGMAGGSADCAATIKCINKLFDLKLSFVEMAKIGAKLGSDVPFCIYSKLSRATGRGEKIRVISRKLPNTYLVVINPSVGLSTPSVFKNHVITQEHGMIEKCYNVEKFEDLCSNVHNDLEKSACELEPKINEIKEYIKEKFDNKLLLSGSGPTILVFCKSPSEMKKIYRYARKKYKNSYYTEMR